jgi:hypothetical protein
MTTSRLGALAVFLVAAGAWAADTPSSTATSTAASTATSAVLPKELTWSVTQLDGDSDWAVRLPLMVAAGLEAVPDHRVSAAESAVLRQKALDDAVATLVKQQAAAQLTLDKKRLVGPLSKTDEDAAATARTDLAAKVAQARGGKVQGVDPPETLTVRLVWPGADQQPWPEAQGADAARKSQAAYAVSGSVLVVGPAVSVHLEVYSAWESRVLASWDGVFAPDEVGPRMADAVGVFRTVLRGRPWAAVSVAGTAPGTRVKVNGTWSPVPWTSSLMDPGALNLVVGRPGAPDEARTVTLTEGQTTMVDTDGPAPPPETLVLETSPSGALLYVDSRYLGPSPQTIDRPRSRTRVRAEVAGGGSFSWEIGPTTPSPSVMDVSRPPVARDVEAAKDRFYWSLAAFSGLLTSTAFLSAWSSEQVSLANAYAANGSVSGYNTAVDRYRLVTGAYGTGVVLTSGVFVWMMFELGDYLAAAQASLP